MSAYSVYENVVLGKSIVVYFPGCSGSSPVESRGCMNGMTHYRRAAIHTICVIYFISHLSSPVQDFADVPFLDLLVRNPYIWYSLRQSY